MTPAQLEMERVRERRRQRRVPASVSGYGSRHQQLRKQLAPQVEAGGVCCARCGLPIIPGTPWDLGHDDNDRRFYNGPEHRACNRRTKGRTKRAA